eukprot:3635842-Rhodomonas_salina.1
MAALLCSAALLAPAALNSRADSHQPRSLPLLSLWQHALGCRGPLYPCIQGTEVTETLGPIGCCFG